MVNRRRTLPQKEVRSWRDRVAVAGGSCTQAFFPTRNYVRHLRCSGAWQVMSNNGLLMPFATDNFTGVMVPLIAPPDVTPANVNFVSGDYSLATGLNPGVGNNNKSIRTNYNPSTLANYNGFQGSIYLRENRIRSVSSNYPSLFGCYINLNTETRFLFSYTSSTNIVLDIWGLAVRFSVNPSGNHSGLITASRSSSTRADIFRNGSSIANSTATASGTRPHSSVHIGAMAGDASNLIDTGSYDDRIYSYFYCGLGLTATQEAAHYAAVQALQTALGRQV